MYFRDMLICKKHCLLLGFIFFLSSIALADEKPVCDSIKYRNIIYLYKVSPLNNQSFSIEIERINISKRKILVQMDYYNYPVIDSLHPIANGDTLYDAFSKNKYKRKRYKRVVYSNGIKYEIHRCLGGPHPELLDPDSISKQKFIVFAQKETDRFYFYDRFFFVSKFRKYASRVRLFKCTPSNKVCFVITLKKKLE